MSTSSPSYDAALTAIREARKSSKALRSSIEISYSDRSYPFALIKGDCLEVMNLLHQAYPTGIAELVFADPPYNLSNDGITCQNGKMVKVNKGEWDRSRGIEMDHEFNKGWLEAVQQVLVANGSVWVSGTEHNIHSVGYAMQQLEYKILNDVTWFKTNAPPNLACRRLTHSHETLIWAAKSAKSKHIFNYKDMKAENGGKQMRSVWTMSAPSKSEKLEGKHPTQKPLQLLDKVVRAASNPGDLVIDPFSGSATTGLAALSLGRAYIGIELDQEDAYLALSKRRWLKLKTELD